MRSLHVMFNGLVIEILHEYDVFGENPLSQFAEVINSILQQKRSFHVLVAKDKTMMIIVDDNGTLIFIDSHMHGHRGALVAWSDPYQGQQAQSFSTWVNQMLKKSHSVGLSICSLTTVTFEQKENVDTIWVRSPFAWFHATKYANCCGSILCLVSVLFSSVLYSLLLTLPYPTTKWDKNWTTT